MRTERGRLLVLGALVIVLSVVLYRTWTATTATVRTIPSNNTGTATRAARAVAPAPTAPDVHLGALDDERPKPKPTDRNLFRFKEKAPPPPPPRALPPVVSRPMPPPGPPPPPPIPLKFIGFAETGEPPRKLAGLIDSTGHIFKGFEGDVIAGQYKILKIGVESMEIAYLDGRGRQTIRLSGS